jgi:hypothetical protein
MPLCEQTSGWWLWKKPCARWSAGVCANCGGRFCETHTRRLDDGTLTCKSCSPDDESWDNMQSSSFSGSDRSQGGIIDTITHGASDSFDTGTSVDSSSSSDSGGGSDGSGSSGD